MYVIDAIIGVIIGTAIYDSFIKIKLAQWLDKHNW